MALKHFWSMCNGQTITTIMFVLVLPATSLLAETNLRVFYGRNTGELIFEGGNRLIGIADVKKLGGSRITYRQDFNLAGIGIEHEYNKWRFSASYGSSGGYVDSGGAKDQDFPLGMNSKESYSGIDTSKWRITDSAYVFSGMPYYINSDGLSVIDYHNITPSARYNIHDDEQYQFYVSFGAHFSYSKYTMYDARIFYALPNVQPSSGFFIGRAIVLYNKKAELPFGAGMTWRLTEFMKAELELLFIVGSNRARLDHVNRGVRIDTNNAGHGMSFNTRFVKHVTNDYSIGLNYRNYRYYSINWAGENHVSPGYNLNEIILTSAANGKLQDFHINEKSYRVELFVERRFGF